MELIHCLECGIPFESRRSLHAHLKAHSLTVGDYYVKNFPKFDMLTGEPIPFKNYDHYILTDFRHKKNMYEWLRNKSADERNFYCMHSIRKHMEGRKYKFSPNHLYLLTHPRVPKMEFFDRKNLFAFFDSLEMKTVFRDEMKKCPDFGDIPSGTKIFEDTREQQPLKFSVESIPLKLDFGDYTISGDGYSYVYVDRKSEGDFKGTMSAGFDRFCAELDRVREFGAYMFIVVESDFQKIYKNNHLLGKKKSNLTYVWENMRAIIVSYSDVCQFVFTGSRENSSTIIPYLLSHGNELKTVDLQFYLESLKCLG